MAVTTTNGFDISAAQGNVDWTAVATSGRMFTIIKATEGLGYVDPRFAANWLGARQARIPRGAYEFAHLDSAPEACAEHTAKTLEDAGFMDDDLPPALDVERVKQSPVGEASIEWQLRWCRRIETLLGRRPMIYTGQGYWSRIGNPDSPELGTYPLWLAAYVLEPDAYVPLPWKASGWTMWQESGDVAPPGKPILHLPGIVGNVDSDVLKGSVDDLVTASILSTASQSPPATKPSP
jgi:lysozyme